jgi:hypothetical protein
MPDPVSPESLDLLILTHSERLKQLEGEAASLMRSLVEQCPDNWRGKVILCLALATGVRIMSQLCPGISEETFVRDSIRGAALWVDSGEPEKEKVNVQ